MSSLTWQLNRDFILIHQTCRIAVTWHYLWWYCKWAILVKILMLDKDMISARWDHQHDKSTGISFWFTKLSGYLWYGIFLEWYCKWAILVNIFMLIKDIISVRWDHWHDKSTVIFILIHQTYRIALTWHYLKGYCIWVILVNIVMLIWDISTARGAR